MILLELGLHVTNYVSVSGQYEHILTVLELRVKYIKLYNYTSTNSVVCALLTMKQFFQSYQAKIMMAKLIIYDCTVYSVFMYQYQL